MINELLYHHIGRGAVRLRQPQHVGQLLLQLREFLGDVAGSPADLGGEVREQQRERAVGEALCELVKPRRHRILLAVACEPTQERGVESTPSGEGHAWTL